MLVSLSLNGLCSCVQQSVVGSNPTQTALRFSWKRRAVLGVVDLFALPYLSTSIPSRWNTCTVEPASNEQVGLSSIVLSLEVKVILEWYYIGKWMFGLPKVCLSLLLCCSFRVSFIGSPTIIIMEIHWALIVRFSPCIHPLL